MGGSLRREGGTHDQTSKLARLLAALLLPGLCSSNLSAACMNKRCPTCSQLSLFVPTASPPANIATVKGEVIKKENLVKEILARDCILSRNYVSMKET